jgi:hypothetical protein
LSRILIKEEEIDSIFEELDGDKSGTLDSKEIKAFLHGRYGLNGFILLLLLLLLL